MNKARLIMVYITIDSMKNAEILANHLLNKKLVACTNIIGEHNPI